MDCDIDSEEYKILKEKSKMKNHHYTLSQVYEILDEFYTLLHQNYQGDVAKDLAIKRMFENLNKKFGMK